MNQPLPSDQYSPYLSCNYLKPLFLSSQRLHPTENAQTGKIDVFEALSNCDSTLDCLELTSRPPSKKLILEWKEVVTPIVPATMHSLVGKKLATYKFQYLGQFYYGDELVEVASEQFAATFQDGETICNCDLESEGWVNCTWLIDFLMNAEAISQNILRQEQLHWHKEGKKGHFLEINNIATDGRSQEQQYFVFKDDYQKLEWSNNIQFPASMKRELPHVLSEAV